jgi:hypothetical protein
MTMSAKALRALFTVPVALAALAAVPAAAFGQDVGAAPTTEAPKPAKEPPPEVKGNRYRITLKTGAKIEGLLPQGVSYEKRDQYGEYVEAKEDEKGAGLRLNYVLNMEGDVFLRKDDILEIKDLGALTEEQKIALTEMVLSTRKKALEARERINREEMAKIAAAAKEEEARAAKEEKEGGKGAGKKDGAAEKKAAREEKDRKRGDELLEKFPPEKWSAKDVEKIQRRSVINGIFPSNEEQEFIDNIDLWKAALARREKEEQERKDAEGDEGGEEGGDEGEKVGEKKETPPAEKK